MSFQINKKDVYINVSGLSRTFEKNGESFKALDNVSFTVNRGDIVCIVGASGCGKSTLLRAVSGLDPVHEGKVTVDGKEITRPAKERGVVFQEHRLFPWMTVEQNIGYALDSFPAEWHKEPELQGHLRTIRPCCFLMSRLVHWIHLPRLLCRGSLKEYSVSQRQPCLW